MKNIIIYFFGFILILPFLNACKSETVEDAKHLSLENDFKTITRNSALESYKIKVPKYMEPTEILNPEAGFQFLNLYKEEYIIIIDESKQDFKQVVSTYNEFRDEKLILNQYSNFQTQFLKQKMTILSQSKLKKSKINNLNARQLELLAKLDKIDENISYFITYLEGKEKLYFVMAWTLESKQPIFKEKYRKIIESFELN